LWLAVGTLVAVLTVVILIVRYSIEIYVIKKKHWDIDQLQQFVRFFIIGVTVLVVAVPEGLPLAVTLALAYSVRVRPHCAHSLVHQALSTSRTILVSSTCADIHALILCRCCPHCVSIN